MDTTDTIAAVATPLGQGGIGIIRISGPLSRDVGLAVFSSARSRFAGFQPYVLHHGWILDHEGRSVDEVLVSYMPGPGSYTGEDVLEINCHGGPAVVQYVLEICLRRGIRMAEPGEFTLRAFLNGRMDLTQAESVAEMVSAPTTMGLDMAAAKLAGRFRGKVEELRETLEGLRAEIAADMDFSEEEEIAGLADPQGVLERIGRVESGVGELLDNFRRHHCLREGMPVILAGKVNAGKSSLLNAILGRARAIVTHEPGTTRDYLEEVVNLQGVPVRLTDTAGIRTARDDVEQAGLQQGRELIFGATLVCILFDQSLPLDEDTQELIQEVGQERALAVGNKADLGPLSPEARDWLAHNGVEYLSISARTGQGVDFFLERVRQRLVGGGSEPAEGELVPNIRQRDKLDKALAELTGFRQGLEQGLPADVLLTHLEAACDHLAEVTGRISTEEVLDRVFSSFCIGK
ncbi:MAG: tRNA uridine-5-carboxymethylaminomethyl(34) synthesis GTPase MnmE [Desulfohalobiaceae bacterium]|nr:tRNA uridine-5-carboxymethylaminomethyl(34) synthesis GTPase MnmE [Desulfohalobiaceae bacterium]